MRKNYDEDINSDALLNVKNILQAIYLEFTKQRNTAEWVTDIKDRISASQPNSDHISTFAMNEINRK